MFNLNIAIDKDDTLNFLTFDICKMAGLTSIPTLDVIKAGHAAPEFYTARTKFFADPKNFANPPYGLAYNIVDLAKEYGFNPLICTKTMSDHPKGDEVVANKFKFLKQYFPDTEAMIVIGRKYPDAIAMVDDSLSNCLAFNKTEQRPFLAWNHQFAIINDLHNFYAYVQHYVKIMKHNIKYNVDIFNIGSEYEKIGLFAEKCRDLSEILNTPIIGLSKGDHPLTQFSKNYQNVSVSLKNNKLSIDSISNNEINNMTFVGEYFNVCGGNPILCSPYYFDNQLFSLPFNERFALFDEFINNQSNLDQITLKVVFFNIESAIHSRTERP